MQIRLCMLSSRMLALSLTFSPLNISFRTHAASKPSTTHFVISEEATTKCPVGWIGTEVEK
jgi:hypothetical protein